MITRRNTLLAGLSALMLSLTTPLPVLATGGDDPISGIDIIIKENPSLVPIKPFSLTDGQLEKLSGLKQKDGARFLSKIIADHIAKAGGGGGKVDVQDLSFAALADEWCAPCKMVNSIAIKFKDPDSGVTYSVLLKLKP